MRRGDCTVFDETSSLTTSGKNRKKKKKRQSGFEDGAEETLPPNMPKGKTKTAVIALAFAIKPKIGMRVFVNLNDFTVWRAELITPEGGRIVEI